jgi:prepilin-type N-terminal cleavage/methylation domain-containing protein
MYKRGTDNSGFSLIELLVIIAILSVLVGVSGYGLSMVSTKSVDKCAKQLASVLSQARTTSMGKYKNVITFTNESSSIKINEHIVMSLKDDGITEDKTADRVNSIGGKNMTIEYSYDGGSNYSSIDSLKVRFDSGTGALKSQSDDSNRLIFRVHKTGTEYYKYVIINSLTGNISVSSSEN